MVWGSFATISSFLFITEAPADSQFWGDIIRRPPAQSPHLLLEIEDTRRIHRL